MPELAEVKLTVKNINNKKIIFKKIGLSNITKNRIDTNIGYKNFLISAESRGKEIKLNFFDLKLKWIKSLVVGLGMTGNFEYVSKEKFEKESHIHLWFEGVDDTGVPIFLRLKDTRRFGTWKWKDSWSENRGPDPLLESIEFKLNIYNNIHCKIFKRPIYEILLNQKYFNGIGNYLRAEIIGKSDINPFESAFNIFMDADKAERLFNKCINLPNESFNLGGAELKDWSTPNEPLSKERKEKFQNWLKFYNKKDKECIVDKQGRNFWYDKKWENFKEKI